MKIVIIGVGGVGFNLAKNLSQENHDVTIIEANPDKCAHATEQLDVAVIEGSGASAEHLVEADVKNADIVVAASDIDEVNIIVCMLTKKMSSARTVARVRNPEYSFNDPVISSDQLGIDLIIHPEKEVAHEISLLVRQASATETVLIADGKLQLLGVRITSRKAPAVGKTLKELGISYPNIPFRIAAINRRNTTIVPQGDIWIQYNDQLYIISDTNSIPDVLKLLGKEDEKLEDVMILGGGKIGRFVAEELEQEIGVKLIETNREKSQRLAEQLRKTLVISGDGTDFDLLAREDIMEMDCYIAVTHDDENNIISGLLAKHLGVKRVIALVNKLEYLPITPTIGIDATVSKVVSTVDGIMRFIRRGKVLSVSSFKGVGAEVIEFTVSENALIANKDLRLAKFPAGAIVGGLIRKNEIIIPTGKTVIKPHDKAVVFALPDAIGDVEKFF